ncbi:uncharacterized protein LOC143017604 [Oratosquilla oratoria]|uniref:uncharacterized protein LOC143017604 n=1 Tax=Oratosquilla oratoria TaxID=337810 RepID=UPI003F767FC8
MDDAHEYPLHAAHASNPPPPYPSTSRDSTASSSIPTSQLESDDSDHSEADSEDSTDDLPSPGPRVMISSDIEEPEEERQEPHDMERCSPPGPRPGRLRGLPPRRHQHRTRRHPPFG